MPDEYDHGEMTALVLQSKAAQKDLDEAKEAIALWEPRVKLATEKGRPELAAQAQAALAEAQERARAAQFEIDRWENEKDMLRRGIHWPENQVNEARNEALLDDFRAIGVDPEAAEINEIAREQSAEDMLAALKARMQED